MKRPRSLVAAKRFRNWPGGRGWPGSWMLDGIRHHTTRPRPRRGEGATATESSARACCPAAHSARVKAADASFSSFPASSMRRWFKSRRWRRRSVVSRATVFRRRACSRRTFTDGESVRRGEDVPILRVPVGRGCTRRWCSDLAADCRCQRAPKYEGASSTLGVASIGCSSLGTVSPRE